jgi:hypothetical protein
MKKLFILSLVFFFLSFVPQVLAQQTGYVPLAPITGLTDPNTVNSTNNLATFFNNLYKYLIGIAAVLAVVMIIWEGLRIATNQDNVSVITDGKGKILSAIFGLILVLAPVLVFTVINPSILNLSLNLQELKTPAGNGTGANTVPPPPPSGGLSVNSMNGWYCYAIVPQNANSGPGGGAVYNFWCAQTNANCFNSLTQTGYSNPPKPGEPRSGASCAQYGGAAPAGDSIRTDQCGVLEPYKAGVVVSSNTSERLTCDSPALVQRRDQINMNGAKCINVSDANAVCLYY